MPVTNDMVSAVLLILRNLDFECFKYENYLKKINFNIYKEREKHLSFVYYKTTKIKMNTCEGYEKYITETKSGVLCFS